MKNFDKAYQLSKPELWTGRLDGTSKERIFQIIQCIDIRNDQPINKFKTNYGILGFACDEGVIRNQGRPGAKLGPAAFRHSFANLPFHFEQTISIYDCGDIVCNDNDLESAQNYLALAIARMHELQLKPLIIGGGHEVAWGHYQGLVQAGFDNHLSIINFDAHLDLRPTLPNNKGSSGTSFLQIAKYQQQQGQRFDYTCLGLQPMSNPKNLLETAKQLNVHALLADEIHLNEIEHQLAFIDDILNRANSIYLTLCLDVFNEAFAPGVSAPQALGLYPWQVIRMLRYITQSHKVISFDIAELSPPNDIKNRTAHLAAALVLDYIYSKNESLRV